MWHLLFLALTACASVTPAPSAPTDIKVLKKTTPFPGSTLYTPNDGKAHRGIVILHGSEGGSLPYNQLEAQFLAAHGYSVMAFCWYNCRRSAITDPHLPLENIELRNAIKAISWLKNSPDVDGLDVALLGVSRGGEKALVLGAIEDAGRMLKAIAVHTPSDTVVSGFNWSAMDKRCWNCNSGDLACFHDTTDVSQWQWSEMKWNPACGGLPKFPNQMNSWLLDGTALQVGSNIEIEKFKKPVFITVGDQDELWDYKKSVRAADRLKNAGQPVELHVFPGEYHVFKPEAENKRRDLLVKFLKQNLGAP